MIQTIDEQINKFLASIPDINDDQISQIKDRCATTVTDDLKKRACNIKRMYDCRKCIKEKP